MLQRPLSIIACGALLGSEQVANHLLRELVGDFSSPAYTSVSGGMRLDLTTAIGQAMDRAWPRRFRLNELERAADLVCPQTIFMDGDFSLLDRTFAELMRMQGNQVVRRSGHAQAFAWLSSEVDPALFAAWHLAQKLEVNDCFGVAVRRQIDGQSPIFEPVKEGVDVADNHVHLGGVSAHEFVFARHILEHGTVVPPETKAVCTRLRELLAMFVQIGARESLQSPEQSETLQQVCGAECGASPTIGLDWVGLAQTYRDDEADPTNWLRGRLAKAAVQGDYARAWLLLLVLLCYIYRLPTTQVRTRVAVMYFVVEVMVLRRSLVVDGQGLRRFASQYYAHPLRDEALDNRYNHSLDSVRRLFVGKGDTAELKVTPQAFKPGLPRRLAEAMVHNDQAEGSWDLSALISGCEDWTPEVVSYAGALERWHFCAHFIRGGPPGKGGRRTRRKELWDEAGALSQAVKSHAGWNLACLLGGSANAHLDFHAGRWLRGLDVAGDETAWPIEFYGPQLRWLRAQLESDALLGATDSRLHTTDGTQPKTDSHRVHFSIHAGEDYDHPLSGLRHVDETIRFCAMRSGDRLGHALALGIDPGEWMEDHGDVLIPSDDHLDNLVWCWYYARKLIACSAYAQHAQKDLEPRIAKLIPEVEWVKDRGATPQDLFKAWLLRRNCPVRLDEAIGGEMSIDISLAVPDFAGLSDTESQDLPRDLFRARALCEAEWNLDLEPKAPRLVLVRTQNSIATEGDPDYINDTESEATLLFMRDLQDHLLNVCFEKELCIEANPTSNLYISRLQRYSEHPIFRWAPPDPAELVPGTGKWNKSRMRKGPVRVLINTDDPGIMPTTLRMELELVEAAARELNCYTPESISKWIDEIRVRGQSAFEHSHLPVFKHG